MAANSLPEALDQLGQQFVDSLRQELDSKRISASGNLYRSVRYEIVGSGDEIGLALFWDDYGDIVDEGRGRSNRGGPNQTWRNKIIGWMNFKGISPRQGITREQLAFLITRKINRKGYKAKPWIQPALDRVINQDFQELFGDAVANEIEKILNK
jgi:hypothetical protein